MMRDWMTRGLDPDSLSRNHATGKDYLGRPPRGNES